MAKQEIKKVRVFKTHYNFTPVKGVASNKPSRTVPDMSITPQEILKKALGGNLPAISRSVVYGGKGMVYGIPIDVTEVESAANNVKRRLDALREVEEQKIHEENVKRAKAYKEQIIEEYKKSIENNP